MECVNKLIQIGYAISVDKKNLKLRYIGGTNPPAPEVIEPLIQELKEHKAEIIDFLECKTKKDNAKIIELKSEYNKILEREKKAEKYLNKATDEQLKKWLPEFNKIVRDLSKLMYEYRELTGNEMTDTEILEGFNVK